MKKLTSLLAMLLMVATISFTFTSCATSTVADEVAKLNKECPYDSGVAVLRSVTMEGNNAVISFETDLFPVEILESGSPETFADLAKFDKHLVDLLKAENKNLILRIKNGEKEVAFTYTPDKL